MSSRGPYRQGYRRTEYRTPPRPAVKLRWDLAEQFLTLETTNNCKYRSRRPDRGVGVLTNFTMLGTMTTRRGVGVMQFGFCGQRGVVVSSLLLDAAQGLLKNRESEVFGAGN
jgi:hypothetical protein